MDKFKVMLANYWPLVPGLVIGVGQYIKDYGVVPPAGRAQWLSLAWGAFIVVVFPTLKGAFTGSRAGTAQTPAGLESVLTLSTPAKMTAFLPPSDVKVIPLTSVGTDVAPSPPASVLVVPPAPPYPYKFKDGKWVFEP